MKLDKRAIGKYIPINNKNRRDLAVLISALVSGEYIKNGSQWYDCEDYHSALKWIDQGRAKFIRITEKNNGIYLFASFDDCPSLKGHEKKDSSYLLNTLGLESVKTEESYEVH